MRKVPTTHSSHITSSTCKIERRSFCSTNAVSFFLITSYISYIYVNDLIFVDHANWCLKNMVNFCMMLIMKALTAGTNEMNSIIDSDHGLDS